eukprot:674719-Hanusia_phi.AAC.1
MKCKQGSESQVERRRAGKESRRETEGFVEGARGKALMICEYGRACRSSRGRVRAGGEARADAGTALQPSRAVDWDVSSSLPPTEA